MDVVKKLKALIVDDERGARSLLRNFLEDHCPEVEVVGEAEDVSSAVKLINKNEIDLVFLDVEMPNENGFALFDYFDVPKFDTIFCTAYSEYAIRAFEVSAMGYLLKPIGLAPLRETVARVIARRTSQAAPPDVRVLQENLSGTVFGKIGVYGHDGVVFKEISDILYFEADGSYTVLHHKQGRDLAVRNIGHFEQVLAKDARFFRIHRSYLVNLSLIQVYSRRDGHAVSYDGKTFLPVSREKKDAFEALMKLSGS
ncbi:MULTISPECIES: LytTR family DNA-binding domain-containing protein [unclassified Flavobacterium]|uniref:LytR/AlgR family response regulator transcription factor n=1 Tax=unclassified Flavobacterium TaxID=196869 RepID=UPI001F1347AE|nr:MULTISPECIES: LytTR family DNA-binding domain-containing protein [unclassified Flavobacterium]UMY66902.1 LytTR family DNA-binding domain-containing protein [Flavobacterium sp. HJ-32-4]